MISKITQSYFSAEEFSCATCDLHFAKAKYLAKHNLKHHGIRYKVGRPKLDKEEIEARKESKKIHGCSTCDEKFRKKSDLHNHILSEHDGYKCSFCHKLYNEQKKLKQVTGNK